jgi:hypothetical protein
MLHPGSGDYLELGGIVNESLSDIPEDVRVLLERNGIFTVGLLDPESDPWLLSKSWPCHKSVLLPLLGKATECLAYGIMPGTPPFNAVADIATRHKGKYRISTVGDVVSKREVLERKLRCTRHGDDPCSLRGLHCRGDLSALLWGMGNDQFRLWSHSERGSLC